MSLGILIHFCVALFLLYKYVSLRRDVWRKRDIVQSDDVVWKFATSNRSLAEIYKTIYDSFPGVPHVGVFQGSRPALLLKDTENIRAVLASDFQNFYSRGIITNPRDILANNLLFMEDYHSWKLVRQKLSPVFTTSRLKSMFCVMERCAMDFVAAVEENGCRGRPFELLYQYTTASVAAAVFGIDTASGTTLQSPFLKMARDVTQPSLKTNCRFILANMFPKLFVAMNFKVFGEYEEFFVGAVKNVLRERERCETPRSTGDFIDQCVALRRAGAWPDASDELIAAQAFFFFLAGTDTSANAMHFTLLELSEHPDVLAKLHSEIDEVFDKCNDRLSYGDFEELNYLEMVVSEAMRKHPPIGAIQRLCVTSTTLPSGNVRLQKNELVVVPILALHMDENYFEKPDTFDPERFAPENIKNIPKYCYMPFGEGNRICIGARFSRLQVKLGLAWLLRRCTLRPLGPRHRPPRYEPSFFSLRSTHATYDIILRNSSQ